MSEKRAQHRVLSYFAPLPRLRKDDSDAALSASWLALPLPLLWSAVVISRLEMLTVFAFLMLVPLSVLVGFLSMIGLFSREHRRERAIFSLIVLVVSWTIGGFLFLRFKV